MTGPAGLRVAYVVKRFPRLSQTFVLNEIAELERQGVRVAVVARQSPDPGERLPDGFPDVPVLPLDRPGIDVAGALRRAGVEHVHAHFATWAAATAARLADELRLPFSFTAHAHDIYHRDVDRAALADLLARAAFAVTVSDANRAFLEEVLHGHGRRGRVVRLHNGVDLPRLARTGRSPVPGRVVSVGRLVPKKGLRHLVEACRLLAATGRACECVVVGEGEEREALELQIAGAGLQGRVVLAGALPHEETLRLLASAEVCTLPCVVAPDGDRDGLPTVLLEALALGVPVVSTPVSGVPEIVVDGESGLLVPPADPAALAGALDRLLASAPLRARLSAAGALRARRDFDLATNVAALAALFRAAAAPGRACA